MSDNYPVDKAIERLEKQVGKLTDELLNTKFQHAKLAAKVEALTRNHITEESVENASENWNTCVCGHHGSAHDLRNRCLVEGCDCRCFSKIRQSFPLESPAPAPDPVCANCKGSGIEPSGNRYGDAVEMVGCHCCEGTGTVPTAEPAPLDPVLVEFVAKWIADHAESSVCNWDDCVEENQRDYRSYAESAIAAIRAYRKDGAR